MLLQHGHIGQCAIGWMIQSVCALRGLCTCERVTASVCSICVRCGVGILTADTVPYVYKRHISFGAISMSLMDKGS